MNVALVELAPRSRLLRTPLWGPVYLPSLAAVLRAQGHAVSILEPRAAGAEDEAPARLAAALRARRPDLVVFDVRMDWWGAFRACAAAARAAAPGARLVAGGRHATLCSADVLRFVPELDAVLVGESEPAVAELAGGAAPGAVTGAVARGAAGSPVLHPVEQLDDLPFPAWDLLDMEYYSRRTPRTVPCLPLRTAMLQGSRGCAGACDFCAEGRLHARHHRFHGAGYLAEAAEQLARTYGIEALYFSDENFLADRARVAALCEEFLRRGIPGRIRWSAQVRADTVDAEILALMRRAGCIQLEFGIESGSERMLRAMGKGIRVAENRAALRLTREAGIRSLAYILVGMPGETREDLELTRRFLAEDRPDIVRLNPQLIYPGTPLAARLVAAGRLSADYWCELDHAPCALTGAATNVTEMPLDELRAAARRLDREAVLPRFLRDFLAHNPPWAVARYFRLGVLPGWFARKLR